jgi:lysyl endopeptidase
LKKGRLWRLAIKSEGAYTLNFLFNHFYMPEGAKFFIYNADKDYILGAFTSQNNRTDRVFGTDIVKGEMWPYLNTTNLTKCADKASSVLERVTHGYKDLFHILEGSVAGSGSCNNDINCPGWEDWQDDKRAVAIMISGGSGFCTGTMVVDVPQSGTPYFLGANHCMGGSQAGWVFPF